MPNSDLKRKSHRTSRRIKGGALGGFSEGAAIDPLNAHLLFGSEVSLVVSGTYPLIHDLLRCEHMST